jgi:hypothetical protein
MATQKHNHTKKTKQKPQKHNNKTTQTNKTIKLRGNTFQKTKKWQKKPLG